MLQMEKSDAELVVAYLEGNEEALKILVERHLKSVYNLAYRFLQTSHDAEDITQEVFLKAWKNLKKYDRNKNLKTWLLHITKNTSIDFLRKKRLVPLSAFDNDDGENFVIENLKDPLPLQTELFEKSENQKMLAEAVLKLPPNYQAVIFLRYTEGLTFDEIGQILEKPMDTVKSQHLRALNQLKKILDGDFQL